ncbi:hypothetical protein QWY85_03390 [Neolewinella lacunae]|uniref:Uncharacterized protein n=1 Tax=Neolewinella lacunae TaxID=1517758 RepID=A0A923T6U6_9BACT|nr:hypothetical protein [Neolewinella lacunae]MBC6992951.1 hypothetical protein [Neolewinella lacunae]MDN3633685.1 hypothetical protein [Neolewinella lacunae]
MWDYNKWLQFIGAFTTIVALLFVFSILGFIGYCLADKDLDGFKSAEESILKSMSQIMATQDTVKYPQLNQLYNLTTKLDNDYVTTIEQNYPRLAGLTLIGLLAAIIAAFLNLLAINRGWQNTNTTLKICLVTTLFIFIITHYSLSVFELQEKCEAASVSYDVCKKARKDICQFVQTNGKDFYADSSNISKESFMADIYYRLHLAAEVRIIPNSKNVPNPLAVQKLLNSQMERQ